MKPEDTKPMNIYQRLAHVASLKEVGYVRKEIDSGSGGKGVARDLVVATVRKHLLEAGVYVSTTQISGETIQTGSKSAKGNELIRYEGWYETSFINVDNPSDRHVVRHEAHGNDYGDKSPGKASTYAEKLNIIKAMLLETGIADEGRFAHEWEDDTTNEEPKRLSARDELRAVYEAMDAEERAFIDEQAAKMIAASATLEKTDLASFFDVQNYQSEEKLAIWWVLSEHSAVRAKIKDGQKINRAKELASKMVDK